MQRLNSRFSLQSSSRCHCFCHSRQTCIKTQFNFCRCLLSELCYLFLMLSFSKNKQTMSKDEETCISKNEMWLNLMKHNEDNYVQSSSLKLIFVFIETLLKCNSKIFHLLPHLKKKNLKTQKKIYQVKKLKTQEVF